VNSHAVHPPVVILILMDGIVLLSVTFIGFASHSSPLAGGRWLTTFLQMLAAWLMTAWVSGLYSPPISTD